MMKIEESILEVKQSNIFKYIWFANILSLFSTLAINFSIGIWTLEKYDSTLSYTLIYLFTYLPSVLLSPYIGAKVDRMHVRNSHIIAVLSLTLNTFFLLIIIGLVKNNLYFIYLFTIINSIFNTLQWCAFQKVIPSIFDITDKKAITKGNGAIQSAQSISYLVAPVLSTLLIGMFSIQILLILLSVIYIVSLLFFFKLNINSNESSNVKATSTKEGIKEAMSFIKEKPIIFSLILYFTFTFFLMGIVNSLTAPFILSFADKKDLALVLTSSGVGMVLGSVIISKWGGPNKRILGVFIPIILLGAFISLAGIRNSVFLISISGFLAFLMIPIIRGCGTAIIQTLTPYELTGRVLSLARMLSLAALPLAYLLSGLMVDYVLKPLFTYSEILYKLSMLIQGDKQINEIGILFVAFGIFTLMVGLKGLLSGKFKEFH